MDRVSASEEKAVADYRRVSQVASRHQRLTNHDDSSDLIAEDSANPRVLEQAEYRLRQACREFELISVAADHFSKQLDWGELLVSIAQQSSDILRADKVVVYSNIDNQLRVETQYPPSESAIIENENATWCVRYLRARVANNHDDTDVRSSLCVPLISTQNRVLAIVEARNKRTGGSFNDHDVSVATCLARVAASAVDRARLFYRMEEWKQSMETLLSFNATVNQHLEPAQMIRQLVSKVTGFLSAAGGAAGIVIQTDTGPLIESDGFFFDGLWRHLDRQWKSGEGIPGTVLNTEFPFLINDYKTNALADHALQAFDIGSCICVPIKNAAEQVLGFFSLFRHVGEPEFSWQDAAFLESLGNTAAVAIENVQLMKSLEIKSDKINSLSKEYVRQLEAERQHIARELHDETGQVLIGLKLRLQVLGGLLNEEQSEAKQELVSLRTQLNDATVQLRDLAKRLRPPTLDELGFEAALRQLVSEYRSRVEFPIHVDFRSEPNLSGDLKTALYRIAQESLTNIAKHADANRVDIEFASNGGQQTFSIRDDGCGFDPGKATPGLGLTGMKERARMLGGRLAVQSSIGTGTAIRMTLSHPRQSFSDPDQE